MFMVYRFIEIAIKWFVEIATQDSTIFFIEKPNYGKFQIKVILISNGLTVRVNINADIIVRV